MDTLIEKLYTLGLSVYEAKVYTSLLSTDESSAPSISQASGVPMSKVYEVMQKLFVKGFVLMSPNSKPKKYKAVDPSIAIEAFIDSKQKRIEDAKRYLLTKLSHTQESKDENIWIVRGQRAVDALVVSLLERAEKDIVCYCASKPPVFLQQTLRAVSKKGIAISSKTSDIAANMISVDGKELLVYASRYEALWIRNPKYTLRLSLSQSPKAASAPES